MKKANDIIEEIERNPEYTNWRYDRNKLRDLITKHRVDALKHAAEIANKNVITQDEWDSEGEIRWQRTIPQFISWQILTEANKLTQ